MATVHPSRMALVPQAAPSERRRGRSPSPRRSRRSPSPSRSGPSSRRRPNERRPSPAYDDYRRPDPQSEEHRRPAENMYPNRERTLGQVSTKGSYQEIPRGAQGTGLDYLESRRLQREESTAQVWPQSPKAPARSPSPKRRSKRSKRDRSLSSSDSSSEDERRKREKKERKRRKEKERSERKEKRKHHSRSRARSSDDEDEDRRRHRKRRHTSRSRSRTMEMPSRRTETTKIPVDNDDEWVVKAPPRPASSTPTSVPPSRGRSAPADNTANLNDEDEDDDDALGPQPAIKINRRLDERSFGGALLRGEGSAMAAFLEDGTDSRIPRRGEIGLTSDEIAKYEDAGYVMSGNRHKRMNAVRMRKENQVISAEEKRGILKLQKEERQRREAILREEFSELVSERLKGADIGPAKPL